MKTKELKILINNMYLHYYTKYMSFDVDTKEYNKIITTFRDFQYYYEVFKKEIKYESKKSKYRTSQQITKKNL